MRSKVVDVSLRVLVSSMLVLGIAPVPSVAEDVDEAGAVIEAPTESTEDTEQNEVPAEQSAENVNEDESNIEAYASSTSGYIVDWTKCGTCLWSIDSKGTLVIKPASGKSGQLVSMDNDQSKAPWRTYATKVTSIRFEGTVKALGLGSAFSGMTNLESVNFSGLDTSATVDVHGLFEGCSSLVTLNFTGLDLTNIHDLWMMFRGCSSLVSIDFTGVYVRDAGGLDYMFSGCSSLVSLDLSGFHTEGSLGCRYVFEGCSSLVSLDISGFGTSRALWTHGWFNGCNSLALIKRGASLVNVAMPAGRWRSSVDGKEYLAEEVPNNVAATYAKVTDNYRVTMTRLYNKWSGEHLYTSDKDEVKKCVSLGWKNEGTAWIAPSISFVPVYRLYNPYSGDHHYTTDKSEYDACAKAGWKQEGIAWYSDEAKAVPLYRGFNRYVTVGTHHYTTNKTEMDTMVKNGWKAEGVAWYGLK